MDVSMPGFDPGETVVVLFKETTMDHTTAPHQAIKAVLLQKTTALLH